MSLSRRNPRRDAIERAVVDTLRKLGCSVDLLSGSGLPDLAIFRGGAFVALAEVKAEHGTLTPAQVRWRSEHCGPPPVTLRSVDDAIKLVTHGPHALTDRTVTTHGGE